MSCGSWLRSVRSAVDAKPSSMSALPKSIEGAVAISSPIRRQRAAPGSVLNAG
jgi:hypothetical protein